ncbi:MAG: hydantoinase B/oxoprolinase family protein [Cyanobacteria bacterium]|nr:hydantoinase B/oxoprolinase family protein [Cyanobacteriota bacterium]
MGQNRVQRVNGNEVLLGSQAQVAMEQGDRLIIETPGGGGYGEDPA